MGRDKEKNIKKQSISQNNDGKSQNGINLLPEAKKPGYYILNVLIKPDAREEKCYLDGDLLCVDILSPPIKGKANQDLIKLLAKRLKISTNQITIRSGHTSRQKCLEIFVPDISIENIYKLIIGN
jgi:uncharacterized protein